MTTRWSIDAWVLFRPASAFQFLVDRGDGAGAWTACRRPLFVAVVLGCTVSLLTSGTLTVRLVVSATIYWASMPIVEALALSIVTWRRQGRLSRPATVDAFFAGHAPWTLLLIGLAGTLASVPPALGWMLLLEVWVWTAVVVVGWSAYIDFCFFRRVLGASPAAAVRDVVLNRALVWTAVFAIFAFPSMNRASIGEAIAEILR